ncbi:MAG: hypothetical protein GPOALKHO_000480 [Sodalis sp.]|nr:MAG: hypothetical protein GPOALKHO_000480 [Sodalis sp.]
MVSIICQVNKAFNVVMIIYFLIMKMNMHDWREIISLFDKARVIGLRNQCVILFKMVCLFT